MKYICIHGHFYQPPRESPWLEIVELQDSAYPYHDWNERITAECYGPNAVARLLGPDGRIVRLSNNYARMSFNFGPTLLGWLREKAPEVYAAILEADREGQARFGGHGPALAQAYNHAILPLCSPDDRRTQVVWGLRDFAARFGREAEGMWLPETAVDLATLEALAAHGVRFTILAPKQAARARPRGEDEWVDVSGGHIVTTRAYLQRLPSGRSIALFFYDQPLSHAVAFERLLRDGGELARRLLGAFPEGDEPRLVHVASDGEAYGHHHAHGDMALAAALDAVEAGGEARLTCYGEFLELHPPEWEVEIVEDSAWSCGHGLGRWAEDCGCNSGRGWHQRWRAPLRRALDGLRDAVAPLYAEHGGAAFRDPAQARDDYVHVLLDRTPEAQRSFLDRHARRQLDAAGEVRALELLELQRHAQLMYTSCGWFFDDISGLEAVQVLLYAGRAIQLGERAFGVDLEGPFLAELAKAPSNLPEHKDGREVYERFVRPLKVDPHKIGAHYAVSSLFERYPPVSQLFCYRFERHDERAFEAGKVKLLVGHATLTALPTLEPWHFSYAALHLGDHNVTGGTSEYPGDDGQRDRAEAFAEAFARVDTPQLMRLMDRLFGEHQHSLASLFRDEQRKVLKRLLRSGLSETMDLYARMFQSAQPLMRFLRHLAVPLPPPLRAATEVLFNTDLRWAFADDEPDFQQVRQLVAESAEWGVHLDRKALGYKFTRQLARTAERWRDQPALLESMQGLIDGLALASELPFEPNLYQPQNVYFELSASTFPAQAALAADGDETARAWVERFLELGDRLGIDTAALKKKMTDLGRRAGVAELLDRLAESRRVPRATYRLQMRKEFGFAQAAAIAGYLAALGVSDVYLSPILQARPGSAHGYDICDPARINDELGGEGGLAALAAALEANGLGAVLDVVPNHMGVNHPLNRWWLDVLENGPASHYADYFDIDWAPINPALAGKVLLPVLGEQYGQALEGGLFRLHYDKGAFTLSYYDHVLPVAPRSYHDVLSSRLEALTSRLGEGHEQVLEYRSILTALAHLPPRLPAAERRAERYREVAIIKRRLAALVESSPEVRHAVESAVELYNGKVGTPASFDALDALIAQQPYRPAYWRVAGDEINYRRFFDINDLAAIRTERREVFEATHALPLRLLAEGQVQALRIDHPDGLYLPAQYFYWLQESYAAAKLRPLVGAAMSKEQFARQLDEALRALPRRGKPWPLYVVAEKILGDGEPLPRDWAVDGTTGYDFLVALNGLFVAGENAEKMDLLYAEVVDFPPEFGPLVATCKGLVMQVAMASEIASLSHQLDRLAERNRRYRDFTLNNLRYAVRELIACLGVYRTYTAEGGAVSDRDRAFLEQATEEAKRRNPRTAEAVFDFLRDTLLLRHLDQFPESLRPLLVEWVLRFQQLTGPVMAKGIEDTAFYVYNRLVSLNEVGGHPDHFGLSVEAFHRQCQDRAAAWPHAMLASSTHDTKRSEDVRARINALSEMPDEWGRAVRAWRERHAGLVRQVDGRAAPAANDQYLFYQTLVGSWPEELLTPPSPPPAPLSHEGREAPPPPPPQGGRGGLPVEGQDTHDRPAPEPTLRAPSTGRPPPLPSWERGAGGGEGGLATYRQRLVEYMHKATKEAKQYTSWVNPNEEYDDAVRAFVEGVLADAPDDGFLASFLPLARKAAFHGRLNSLAQVAFKLTCPGVPDFYQGSELWDLSLVDPDNRRPVDYDRRRAALADVHDRHGPEAVAELLAAMADGGVKLFVIARLLRLRRERGALFDQGDYHPVAATGQHAEAVCAFERRHEGQSVVVAGCVRPVRLGCGGMNLPLGERWGDTALAWPGEGRLRDVFTGEVVEARGGAVRAADVFAHFPVAVLEAP